MTLTIELPKLVADHVATWDSETLRNIAVEAVVQRIQDDAMTEMFDANGESIGFRGPVLEEIPMDDETIAALKEARADRDAGRHYSTEEVRSHVMATIAQWERVETRRSAARVRPNAVRAVANGIIGA